MLCDSEPQAFFAPGKETGRGNAQAPLPWSGSHWPRPLQPTALQNPGQAPGMLATATPVGFGLNLQHEVDLVSFLRVDAQALALGPGTQE